MPAQPQPPTGKPVQTQQINQQPPKKPIYKKWWFWVIIVVIIAAIGAGAGSGAGNKTSSSSSMTTSSSQSTSASSSNSANNSRESNDDTSSFKSQESLDKAISELQAYMLIYNPSEQDAWKYLTGKTTAVVDGKNSKLSYSDAQAAEVLNQFTNIWQENALAQARQWLEAPEWTEAEVREDLQAQGFTSAQIEYAIANM